MTVLYAFYLGTVVITVIYACCTVVLAIRDRENGPQTLAANMFGSALTTAAAAVLAGMLIANQWIEPKLFVAIAMPTGCAGVALVALAHRYQNKINPALHITGLLIATALPFTLAVTGWTLG